MRLPRKSGITSTSLEESWLRLAIEIETGQKLLDLIDDISHDLVPIVEAAE
jgi:hypothetical protein